MKAFFYILFYFPVATWSQNLLENGNFEEENICAEYKVRCAPEAWIYTIPSLFYYPKDPRLAHGGIHCLALIAGNSDKPFYRTFVRSRLICGLQKGKTYELRFFVKSSHPILDSLGIYFTAYDFLFEKSLYHKIVPSHYLVHSKDGIKQGDTGWQKVSFQYKATGAEAFIALGNFSRGALAVRQAMNSKKIFYTM
jgi:hypothetical protein